MSFKGVTKFICGKKEEIIEASRREASMMSCLPIGFDLTHLS